MGIKKFFTKLVGMREPSLESQQLGKTEEQIPAEKATKSEKMIEETTHAMESMAKEDIELGKAEMERMRTEEEKLEQIDKELETTAKEENIELPRTGTEG